jgi:hypothetical protein
MGMLALPRRYIVTVAKSWGRAISGPVLALLGLVLLICQATITDSQMATAVFKYLSWTTLGAAGLMIFVAQYEVWKQELEAKIKTEEDLTRRVAPKAIIRNLTPRVWPQGQAGVNVTGKEYYFDIFNCSEVEPLENVRAEVAEIVPDAIGYPNAPLHIRNEDYNTTEISINPGSARQIDLITGPVNAPRSQQVMIVAHTLNAYRNTIPNARYRITVRVSARNAPPAMATFGTWIEHGELQCVVAEVTH